MAKLERRCAEAGDALGALQAMHDALQGEHTAVCGQLTAAAAAQGAALDRLQRLAQRLAVEQREKVGGQWGAVGGGRAVGSNT